MPLPEFSVLEPDRNIPDYPHQADNFLYEPKYNGIRALLYYDRESCDVSLFSRKGVPIKVPAAFKDALLEAFTPCRNAVLDGELIAVDKDHLTGNYDALLERSSKPVVLQFRCFDILYYNGIDVRTNTLTDRKKVLAAKFPLKIVQFRLVPYADNLDELTSYPNQEGYVAKQKTSKYEAGRQRTWLKIKELDTEMVMCTGFQEGLGYSVGHIGTLNLSWIIHDPNSKKFVLKEAGFCSNFATLDAHLKVEAFIRKMSSFQQFPVEISYLRKNSDGKVYHATFHKIVSLED